jgi:hypothetical protein
MMSGGNVAEYSSLEGGKYAGITSGLIRSRVKPAIISRISTLTPITVRQRLRVHRHIDRSIGLRPILKLCKVIANRCFLRNAIDITAASIVHAALQWMCTTSVEPI